jgi:hypothetical protein
MSLQTNAIRSKQENYTMKRRKDNRGGKTEKREKEKERDRKEEEK